MRKLGYGFILIAVAGCNQTGFNGGGNKKTPPKTTSSDLQPATTSTTTSNDATNASTNDLSTAGANAVTAGSFTAWTIPANPKEWEDYKVIVRVTLPSNVSSYSIDDLSGSIVGSDLYTQNLRDSFATNTNDPAGRLIPLIPQFKRDGGYAYIGIMVPGAKNKVQDTITIKSGLLNETQDLSITFN